MNEQKLISEMDIKSRLFSQKYESKFRSIAENSRNFGKFRKFSKFDAVTLGNMFERYRNYERYCRENGSASSLGTLPMVAMDLVAAVYGTSIAPIISSMQDLSDESGLIYFKKALAQGIAGGTWAGTNPGDQTMDAKNGWTWHNNGVNAGVNDPKTAGNAGNIGDYMSALGTLNLAITAGQTSITGTLGTGQTLRTNIPIQVSSADGAFQGVILNGQLLNNAGITTTSFSYDTGAFTFTAPATAFPAATTLTFKYNVDFEKTDTLPQVEFALTTDTVFAEVLALGEMLGTLKAFQFNQRFGKVADDEVLQDLTGHMAAAESTKVIRKALELITSNTLFDPTTPAGRQGQTVNWYSKRPTTNAISEFEHRQSFRYALATADSVINVRAGRGFCNRYIAGDKAVEYFRSLNGWTPEVPNTGIGAYVYGYLDGIPVIRASLRDGIASNQVIALYINPISPFEAPIVTATYMPIFFTNTIQSAANPLQGQKAVASWKAFKAVVPQFAAQINIVDSVEPA